MAITVELATSIANGPEQVWSLLGEPRTWSTWWKGCVVARTVDGRTLRDGSPLELVLQPKHQKLTLQPVVDLLTERKTLSLTHRSAFLQGTVAWYLQEGGRGTNVRIEGAFEGILPLLMKITGQGTTPRLSLHANLRGLKKAAERILD